MGDGRKDLSADQVRNFIENLIGDLVEQCHNKTSYGKPVIGYGTVDNPLFTDLKELIDADHLIPRDLLPGAKTVIAFYLPFSSQIVQANLKNPQVAAEWALAYQETNSLLEGICHNLSHQLNQIGVKSAFLPPTHNFHREKLVSYWSHKHVGYICGLGNFGLHRMLITERGCAGRLTSLVIDYPLDATTRKAKAYCLYSRKGTCQKCIEACPSGALTISGLDRETCYNHLLQIDADFSGHGELDVCGKCACACPYAIVE